MDCDTAEHGCVTSDELLEKFGRECFADETVLSNLLNLGIKYQLSGEDLYNKWEVYAIQNESRLSTQTITLDVVRSLESDIILNKTKRNAEATCRRKTKSSLKPFLNFPLGPVLSRSTLSSYLEMIQSEKALKNGLNSASTFEESTNVNLLDSGDIVYNGSLPGCTKAISQKYCVVKLLDEGKTYMRYMYNEICKIGEYINNKIEKTFAPLNKIESGDFVAGIIHCDSFGEGLKINDHSLLLESCKSQKMGFLNLNLSYLKLHNIGYSLFPGQIVAVKGKITNSNTMNVESILYPGMAPHSVPLNEFRTEYPTGIMVACGPFTTEDLSYAPLEKVIEKMLYVPNSLAILLGPFVDERHPIPPNTKICDVFKEKISPQLQRLLSFGIKVILMPSIRDLISEWLAIPQMPLTYSGNPRISSSLRESLGISEEVLLYPNPATFQVNNTLFKIINSDAIDDISKHEVFSPSKTLLEHKDLELPISCKVPLECNKGFFHILSQRSLHPFLNSFKNTGTLDLSKLFALEINKTPDVVCIPSSVTQQLVENINNCICINPGCVVGSENQRASVTRITLHPSSGENSSKKTSELIRVDIHYL